MKNADARILSETFRVFRVLLCSFKKTGAKLYFNAFSIACVTFSPSGFSPV
jgi:hypothetical protein